MKFNKNKEGNATVVIIVFIALLALGVWWYLEQSNNDEIIDNADFINQENFNGTQGTSIESETGDQTIGGSNQTNEIVLAPTETGNFVTVSSASLDEPGFVVIYKVNSNSESEVIGNSDLLLPGLSTNIEIELDTVIAEGQTIIAVLHQDDGDNAFEFPGSDLYLGNPNQTIVSDVDVVDVPTSDEDTALQAQVETYLENNFITE